MITKRMESISAADLVSSNKLCCKVMLGFNSSDSGAEEPPGSSARRNLFGSLEDSSAVNELLLRQAGEMAQRSSLLWNFDFAEERPIPGGRYLWERIGGAPPHRLIEDCGSGEKENSRTETTSDSKTKCNTTKSRLLQTTLKGYMPVLKRKTSNRLRSKRPPSVRFLSRRPRDCILSTAGSSTSS